MPPARKAPKSIEVHLASLSALDLSAPSTLDDLHIALQSKSNLIVAKAAKLVMKAKMGALAGALESAFDRFMVDSASADRGCGAKLAIAQALYELGHSAEAAFLTGIHHVQMEPSFGGAVDSAAELRGVCALGLVRIGYRDLLIELADLLMDPSPQARMMAARALAYAERPEGALLLRVKILGGDNESQVLAECFTAILRLDPRRSLKLVGRFLDDRDRDLAQSAALAVGDTKSAEAFDLLHNQWQRTFDPAARELLLVPLAILRRPEAIDLLIGVVRDAPARLAAPTIEAMAMYRHDEAVRTRILAAATGRQEEAVKRALAKILPGPG